MSSRASNAGPGGSFCETSLGGRWKIGEEDFVRVLVTGSSGFIGTYLVGTLQDRGHQVVGVDREPPSWSEPDEFVHGDILDQGVLRAAFEDIDCVFHLAAAKDDWGISREEYFRDNARTTEKLLEVGVSNGVRKWFHYSTVGVLDRGYEPKDESAPLDPGTDYGASKAEAERLVSDLSDNHPELSVVILRPSAVFGPRHPPSTNVHRLIEAIRAGRFVMVGAGCTPKTTSYIENLLEATVFLMRSMEPGLQVYHYVDDPVMTTNELVGAIYRLFSRDPPRVRLPLWAAKPVAYLSDVAAAVLGIDFPITAARIEKFCRPTNFSASAIRELGFEQPVPNDQAIRRTVEWHLKQPV